MTAENLLPVPELYAPFDAADALKMEAAELVSWDLTPRQICDLELLMNGGFYPLTGFLGQDDYNNVVQNMRLANGTLWPMPITLDVSAKFSDDLKSGQKIALRDQEGVILALFIWVAKSQAFPLLCTMISVAVATHPTKCAHFFANWAGVVWLHSKPATHCTARIRN